MGSLSSAEDLLTEVNRGAVRRPSPITGRAAELHGRRSDSCLLILSHSLQLHQPLLHIPIRSKRAKSIEEDEDTQYGKNDKVYPQYRHWQPLETHMFLQTPQRDTRLL